MRSILGIHILLAKVNHSYEYEYMYWSLHKKFRMISPKMAPDPYVLKKCAHFNDYNYMFVICYIISYNYKDYITVDIINKIDLILIY